MADKKTPDSDQESDGQPEPDKLGASTDSPDAPALADSPASKQDKGADKDPDASGDEPPEDRAAEVQEVPAEDTVEDLQDTPDEDTVEELNFVSDDDAVEDPQDEPAEEAVEDLQYEPVADTVDDLQAVPSESEPMIVEKEKIIETRSGFGSALLGGIVAAILGFIAARSDFVEPYLPGFLRSNDLSDEISALQKDISTQTDAVAKISAKVDAIAIPDIAPVEASIAEVKSEISPLGARIDSVRKDVADMDTRLTEVEKRPIDEGVSKSAIAAYERELDKLQKAMATQRSEVESLIAEARAIKAEAGKLEANAEAAAQQAANRATLAQLRAALDSGSPYSAEVDDLTAAKVDVPADLAGPAADGVATLSALNTSFAPAARSALAAARAENSEDDRGIGSFLQRQLGARSVEPRDGDDPDAILSRAEAATANGQLDEALKEIAALPDPAQAAMSTWVDRAQARLAAITAANSLADSLNSN